MVRLKWAAVYQAVLFLVNAGKIRPQIENHNCSGQGCLSPLIHTNNLTFSLWVSARSNPPTGDSDGLLGMRMDSSITNIPSGDFGFQKAGNVPKK
jgi:hypothetical protein